LSFLGAFGGWPLTNDVVTLDTPACRDALAYVRGLRDAGTAPHECGYECTTARFYAGDYPFAINGDWALGEARRAMGERLGVTTLPRAAGHDVPSPRATHALLFPGDALNGPKSAALRALAAFLGRRDVQMPWADAGGRVAARTDARRGTDRVRAALTAQLASSRVLPNGAPMAYAWSAMNKGLKLYLRGLRTADDACRFMAARTAATSPASAARGGAAP
jgi:maltose-binding protein MalE